MDEKKIEVKSKHNYTLLKFLQSKHTHAHATCWFHPLWLFPILKNEKKQIILKNQASIHFKREPKVTRFVHFDEYVIFKNRAWSYLCFFPHFFFEIENSLLKEVKHGCGVNEEWKSWELLWYFRLEAKATPKLLLVEDVPS